MQNKHIHILKMGGTIEFRDPAYEKINNLMKLDVSIDGYLENLIRPHFSYDIEIICEKDSREITQEDLNKLSPKDKEVKIRELQEKYFGKEAADEK